MRTEGNAGQGSPEATSAADQDVVKTLGVGARKSRKRVALQAVIVIAIVALGGGAFLRCTRTRAAAAIPEYTTAAVARSDIQVTITATGTVKGLNTVEVGAETSGKLKSVRVDFNDPVKKGQVLAEIDPEQQRAAVDEDAARVTQADASIRQANATLIEAQQSAARAAQQATQGLVSQKDLEAAKAAADRAEASLASAKASATVARATLKSSRSKLEKTSIISPIDGIVLSRLVEAGQTVTAGLQTPVLFKLAQDLTSMSLNVFIDESDVGRAKEGQPATFTVDAYPDKTFPSKLLSLRNEPKTDQSVVTYEAVLAVNNADLLLRPGMTATAIIVAETHAGALAVPNAALRFTPPAARAGSGFRLPGGGAPKQVEDTSVKSGPRVYVLSGGAPVAVPVKVGASDGRVTEILGGDLAEGAPVIVDVVEKK